MPLAPPGHEYADVQDSKQVLSKKKPQWNPQGEENTKIQYNTLHGNATMQIASSRMFHPRPCGCKGKRTCLVCENEYGAYKDTEFINEKDKRESYIYCPHCNLAYPGWDENSWKKHPNHDGKAISFGGLFWFSDHEDTLFFQIRHKMTELWPPKKKKLNYGPKCNFKKHRLRNENFTGYPAFTKFIQDRFSDIDILKDFQTVEQCSLEYNTERGASIDPHIDDCWIWGERIPTLSLLSDSVLTLNKFEGPPNKYNLPDTLTYPRIMKEDDTIKNENEVIEEFGLIEKGLLERKNIPNNAAENGFSLPRIVRLPMPRRSLLVFYGAPRYEWEHSILREDIDTRRVCITYREITPPYLPCGPKADIGLPVLASGAGFWDHFWHLGISCSS
ncbi:unnamed protein product, partial [Meganyctiphanes norvegica]